MSRLSSNRAGVPSAKSGSRRPQATDRGIGKPKRPWQPGPLIVLHPFNARRLTRVSMTGRLFGRSWERG